MCMFWGVCISVVLDWLRSDAFAWICLFAVVSCLLFVGLDLGVADYRYCDVVLLPLGFVADCVLIC